MNKQKGYFKKYCENNYDSIGLKCVKGDKELLKTEAQALGMSMSAFIRYCVNQFVGYDLLVVKSDDGW